MNTRHWRRLVGRHRRLLAAAAAALAVLTGLSAVRPPDADTVDIVVAATDLPAGRALGPDDLVLRAVPAAAASMGSARSVDPLLGRVLAVPVLAGAPVTATTVTGPDSLGVQARVGGAPTVAVPVRLADAATAGLLRPGDLVDVWAASATADLPAGSPDTGSPDTGAGRDARRVAAGVRVVAVPMATDRGGLLDGDAGGSTGIVVLAMPPSTVAAVAGAAARDRLSVAVLPAR